MRNKHTMESIITRTPSELIQNRSSWRSCTGEAIPIEKLTCLDNYIKNKTHGIWGNDVRFELAAAKTGDPEELRGLGTYGFIRGAAGFIIGALQKETCNLEDYGYLMEDIILFATNLELATCWLGGSFKKDNFSARINTQPHEIVPAVVSVGIHSDKRNVIDRLIRNVAGSKKRKNWEHLFFGTDFHIPLTRESAGIYAHVFDMVRLSPSASNKQPWRLVLDNSSVHFFLKRTEGYQKSSIFSDLQRIDIGIAMCHFEKVCKELKISGEWSNIELPFNCPQDWEYTITWVG